MTHIYHPGANDWGTINPENMRRNSNERPVVSSGGGGHPIHYQKGAGHGREGRVRRRG